MTLLYYFTNKYRKTTIDISQDGPTELELYGYSFYNCYTRHSCVDSSLACISKYLLCFDSFGIAATLNQSNLSTIRKQTTGDIFLGYPGDPKDLLCRLHHIIQVCELN